MKQTFLTHSLLVVTLMTSLSVWADTLDHSGSDTFALEAAAMLEQQYYSQKSVASAQPTGAPAAVRIGAGSLGKASGGEWSAIIPWTPHIPVTAATLPDGRILTFASNERTTFPSGPEFTYAATWDPSTGAFLEINNTRHDMFCGGVAMLPDGRVHVAGGRATTVLGSVFDWRNNSWSALANMNDPRWYNTNITLPDGQVAAFSGSGGVNTVERWNSTSGWSRLTGVDWSVVTSEPGDVPNWHPFLSVAPSGKIIHFGPTDVMHWVNPNGTGSMSNTGTNVPGENYPKEGCWVVYNEGRVLVAGGGQSAANTYTPSNTAYTVDFRNGTPIVSTTGSMKFARSFANAVALPNGEVLVMGGNTSGLKFSDAGAVLAPEIWNPTTGAWREVTDGAVPRAYHSVALLLKDGRVLSAGGGLGAGDHRDGEVYTPPNLFKLDGTAAERPVINSAPASIGLGTTFNVSATAGISRFTFIRLAAITHSVTTDLRFLELPFTETSPGNYSVTGRSSANVMTPGYWYLFALNAAGAHSVAAIVQVDSSNAVTLTNPGTQSGFVGTAINLQFTGHGSAGSTLTYSASGLPEGLIINASTGLVTGVPAAPGASTTTVSVSNGATSASATFAWTIYTGQGLGLLKREWWMGIAGETLASLTGSPDYPNNPTANDTLTSFQTPVDWADSMGQRVSGYLRPSVSGKYSFSIASDDEGRLLLSTDNSPANAVIIARVPSWSGPQIYNKFPEQTSALISLQAGKSYYIEALMKEGGGGDHLSVVWTVPGTTKKVIIPSSAVSLKPIIPNVAPVVTNPGNQVKVVNAAIAPLQIQASDGNGDALKYSATGLPAGLSISATSGVISGSPTSTGTTTTVVSVTDNIAPAVTTSFTWTINSPLSLSAISGLPVSAGSTVTLGATTSGGAAVKFSWSFGDGSADTAPSSSSASSHVFTNPGRYIVTVTATDNSGAQLSKSYAQAVYAALTAAKPTASSPIAYETRSTGNNRVWSVNPDNDSVSVFDTATHARVAEITVGNQPETLAIAPDGRVWVANNKASTLSIISPTTLAVVQTISLARGSMPYGIAFSPNNADAWIVLEGTGKLLRLNPSTAATVATISVGAKPRHVSITADSNKVLVTRFLTPMMPGESTGTIALTSSANVGAEVVNVSPATNAIASTIILHHSDIPDSSTTGRGIPNYLGAATISPDGRFAWVPSKQDNIKRGKLRDGQDLTHDSAVRSIVSLINLGTNTEDLASRIDFNDAGIAKAAAFDPRGIYLFVAHEGGREVAVVDAWNHAEIARFTTGRAPQGLVVSPDGSKLYVTNFMDRSVTVHDLSNLQAGGNASITTAATMKAIATERLTAQVLLGKQHFYDSRDPRISLQQYISCAACHDDGGHDGRVWDFTGFGEGLRNTITLKGAAGMSNGPVHWTGNFDEIQDFEGQIRHFDLGQGLMTDAQFNAGTRSQPLGDAKAGVSADLDALAAYVTTLAKTDVSPFRNADASLTSSAVAGKQSFAQLNCTACHSSSKYTDSALNNFHDVGTAKPSSGQRMNGPLPGFDTPTLRGLWTTAPYLHDGSAITLEAAILAHTKGTQLPIAGSQTMSDLVNYLQSIDNDELSPVTTFAVTLNAPSSAAGAFTVQGSSAFSFFTGLTLSDFIVTNGTASNLSIDDSVGSFQLTVSPSVSGNVTVALPTNTIGHSSGSTNIASNITSTVVNLIPANRAPIITHPGNQSTVRGEAVSLQISASDPDGNPLTYTASNLPAGLSITASTGLISGTVTSTAAASYSSSITVSDGSLSASTSFIWATTAPASSATITSESSIITAPSFILNLTTSAVQSDVTNAQFTLVNASIQAIAGGSTAWAITLQPLVAGPVSVLWSNGSTTSNTLSLSYNPPAPFTAKVNFQPSGSPLPSGYIADSGELYTARNGQTYGWSVSHSDQTRIRHIAADLRQDTFIRMRINARWEIAVPNGSYDVVLSVGDAGAATRNSVSLEGNSVWSNQRLNANVFSVKTLRVLVGDGRLTLDCPSTNDFVTRINFIDIRAADAPIIAGRTNGLTTDYFAGRNFEQLRFARIDSCIDNDWLGSAPDARLSANNFSVRWHGCVVPRYTETYTFTTTSDDGIRLWVNGSLIIDQWNDHGAREDSGNIALTANVPATIKVEFYDNGGDAVAKLAWQSPSQAHEIVPNERLLINETGTNSSPYPPTFATWLSGGRGTSSDPLANADGDSYSNLLEYALGSSPTTGVQISEGLRLDLDSNDQVQASIVRPIGLTDLTFTLEDSSDMRTWSTQNISPIVSDLGDGTERLVWSNLSASILRVRVSLNGTSVTDTTPSVAVQRLALRAGTETVGVSVLRAPIFSGLIRSVENNLIVLNDEASPSALVDSEARYYLEVNSGPLAGHRLDVSSLNGNLVSLAWDSPRNTLNGLPAGLVGASIEIRPHITLGSIFNPARFQGGNALSTSEQVLFYAKGNYTSYWLYRGNAVGENRAWVSATDVSFTSHDSDIIPPGTGVMIKLPAGATQTQLAFTGHVRANAFVKLLAPGNNLIASPWPVPQSPASLGLTIANGFTGGNSVSQSDQIQVWAGDTTPGSTSFVGYWLLNSNAMQRWVSNLSVSFVAVDTQTLLSASRAIYYNAKPASITRPWTIPMP